jgi:glycine cleavage system H protein
VSDIYSPVDGEVIQANPEIEDDPGLVNTDPYGAGWLLRIRLTGETEPTGLLTAEEYTALTKEAE